MVDGSKEQKMSLWRCYADVSFLQIKKGQREEEELVVEERASLQSVVCAVLG